MTIETKRVEALVEQISEIIDARRISLMLSVLLADAAEYLKDIAQDRDRMLRGEHICIKCGLRQDAAESGISQEF